MKAVKVSRSKLKGEVAVPPSKSQTLRAVLFGALASGRTVVKNPLSSPDTDAMCGALRSFGAKILSSGNELLISGLEGRLKAAEDVIQAGNSGIVLRFMAAASALSSCPIVITGDYSLRHLRPVEALLQGLRQLGVKAVSTKGDGFAPVIIQGPLKSGKAVISGEDSQPVSGLLIASAFAEGPVELHVKNPGERPWVQLTIDWLNRLGAECENDNFERYFVKGGLKAQGFDYTVPGDFSTASFPIVAALITGSRLVVKNLDFSDSQGDKKLIPLLQEMGADIQADPVKGQILIGENSRLKGREVDLNEMIDAISPLALLACFAEGKTVIRNAEVARTKECDRIGATARELGKMGAKVEETADGLIIYPCELKASKALESHSDHRMAMTLCVAAMGAKGESSVKGVECVEKTYGNFFKDFQALGASIEVS